MERKCRNLGPYPQQKLDIEPPDNDDSQIKDNISSKTEQENAETEQKNVAVDIDEMIWMFDGFVSENKGVNEIKKISKKPPNEGH